MTIVPKLSGNKVENLKINFLKRYAKTESISILAFILNNGEINAKYFLDYDESVWSSSNIILERFFNEFAARAMSWYGEQYHGGRCNTMKRTYGEMIFSGCKNYKIEFCTEQVKGEMTVTKKRFSDKLFIAIISRDNKIHSFECEKLVLSPSGRILLLDRKTHFFVDKTEILSSNGLHLLDDKYEFENFHRDNNTFTYDARNFLLDIPPSLENLWQN